MDVRRLRESEVAAFVEDLWLPFARETAERGAYDRLVTEADDIEDTYRRERLDAEDVATFVAERDGALVGYASVEYEASPSVIARGDEGSIDEVYVAPDYRERGIADELLDRAERWATDQGCERVVLSVDENNETARRLYESRSYAVRRLTMEKRL